MGVAMTEKTISEFLKEMAAVGFDYNFRATDGERVYVGSAKDGVLKVKKQLTPDELKQRITARLSK
jgi:hypothetical protein